MPHDNSRQGEMDATICEVFAVDSLEQLSLFRAIVIAARLLKHLAGDNRAGGQLSSARLRLLAHLAAVHRHGQPDGMAPSELSRFLSVSRNTISALLNGLEEQGLVERHLHPTDRRQFLVRITPSGLAVVHERSPEFAQRVADLLDALAPDEQATLLALLHKLIDHMASQAGALDVFPPEATQASLDNP